MSNKNIIIKVRGVVLHEGKLLIAQYLHSIPTLPGGHLEYGEDIITCLKREFVEELGVEPEIGKLLYVVTFLNNDKTEYIEFFFEVKNGEKYLHIDGLERTHAYELAGITWISPGDDISLLPKQFNEDFKNNKIFEGETKFINELN